MMRGRCLMVDGVRTHYLDEGSGPTVVLLHGAALAVDAYVTWCHTIEDLKGQFRVVAIDQVGFGHTDMPADGIYKNRLERVDHVLATLRALNIDNACVVGHSEGGFMAARLAIVAPEIVSQVVIVNSGGTAPYLGGTADKEWIAAAEAAYNEPGRFDNEDSFIRASARLSHTEDLELERILRENYRHALAVGQGELFRHMPGSETGYDTYGDLQAKYVLPFLAEFDKPVLLIWSTGDATVPIERGLKLLECIPGAELHVLQDCAHNVMHDQRKQFSGLLRGWCHH